MDYTNKALGLRVQTQIPLNVKKYKENEESLKDLGINNNLAFIYEQGLIIYCIEEGSRWEWREVKLGEENTGLLDTDFIYPDNIITFNINYSNKSYNFFKKIDQNNYVRFIIINPSSLPIGYDEQDICDYILNLPSEQRTILETDSKWNIIIGFIAG